MPRQARGEILNPAEVQVVHAVQRCVRRGFLCGQDPYTGNCYEHRREWIRQRLEFLAGIFGIDCLTYTAMHNHIHLVLRSRPDVVAAWSDQEVARRWLRLFPKRRNKDGSPAEAHQSEIDAIVNDAEVLAARRNRLSDVSWWMKCTCEHIARRANAEDEVTGHFWEGRYKATLLLDEASLLACAAYVDLNPVRAAMAQSPEESQYTGAKDRIDDLAQRTDRTRSSTREWERSRRRERSGWMSPVELDERADTGVVPDSSGRRASLKGFLAMSMLDYLQLLDWTGRQLRSDKRGVIPGHLLPILSRIGLDSSDWCELVKKFGRVFKRAAGSAQRIAAEAQRRQLGWMHAPGNPLTA